MLFVFDEAMDVMSIGDFDRLFRYFQNMPSEGE